MVTVNGRTVFFFFSFFFFFFCCFFSSTKNARQLNIPMCIIVNFFKKDIGFIEYQLVFFKVRKILFRVGQNLMKLNIYLGFLMQAIFKVVCDRILLSIFIHKY